MKKSSLNSFSPKTGISLIIKGYQKISRVFIPRSCRFYPSCSSYALEAVNKYGAIKGLSKSFIRILKCSPFSQGGYDPVR